MYMYTVSYLQIFNLFELSPSWQVFLFSLLVSSPFWSIFFPSWPVSPFSLCVSSTLRSVSLSPSSYTCMPPDSPCWIVHNTYPIHPDLYPLPPVLYPISPDLYLLFPDLYPHSLPTCIPVLSRWVGPVQPTTRWRCCWWCCSGSRSVEGSGLNRAGQSL